MEVFIDVSMAVIPAVLVVVVAAVLVGAARVGESKGASEGQREDHDLFHLLVLR